MEQNLLPQSHAVQIRGGCYMHFKNQGTADGSMQMSEKYNYAAHDSAYAFGIWFFEVNNNSKKTVKSYKNA